ncbi:MAG: DUF485 domain-containing protein [Thauera sp.]|nr:DUF485 domain-containing protein [Thauera sp.]
MEDDLVKKITANPKYQKLVGTRTSYGWMLTIIMLIVYYGYIAVIAFSKETLAAKLGAGVMTVGIPIGLGVILFTIIITGIYVRRANSEFDALTQDIVKECGK